MPIIKAVVAFRFIWNVYAKAFTTLATNDPLLRLAEQPKSSETLQKPGNDHP
jgi:hypothetical protein